MTRRRFFAPPESFRAHGDARLVTLGPEETRHLRDVLRLKGGDEVFIFDGEGHEYQGIVAGSERAVKRVGQRDSAATLEVREQVAPWRPESPLELSLGVALLKGEKFDLVVQKATELGVIRIVPLMTKRADVRWRHTESETGQRTMRWQRLALEAAKQCGRARVPTIETAQPLATIIAPESPAGTRLLFAERDGQSMSVLMEHSDAPRAARVMALIGPEGGWDDEELEAAKEAGWMIITLGGRTLRAETAAMVVAALLQHRFGDLN